MTKQYRKYRYTDRKGWFQIVEYAENSPEQTKFLVEMGASNIPVEVSQPIIRSK